MILDLIHFLNCSIRHKLKTTEDSEIDSHNLKGSEVRGVLIETFLIKSWAEKLTAGAQQTLYMSGADQV